MSNSVTPFDPLRDPTLRSYLDDVLEWHGYVRTLGLPTMKDNPSVPISRLYVAPALSVTPVSPDAKELPEGESILKVLETNRHLVVQGDPGSGKSTLVNWLAWRLAAGLSAPLPEFLSGAIPIPLILRELNPEGMESFDKLLASFMQRPVAKSLNLDPSPLIKALKTGKALVLIDGLDELPEHQRKQLMSSLRKAFVIYKKAIWLITSRVVGFDENFLTLSNTEELIPEDAIKQRFLREGVPSALISMLQGKKLGDILEAAAKPAALELGKQLYHELAETKPSNDATESLLRALVSQGLEKVLPENERRPWRKLHRTYVMPFDDKRIESFSRAWYQIRGSLAQETATCENFLRSVRTNQATHTLARNPQILTLMALVFRTRLDLPQGRALLYEYITQAYLESIDQAYGILDARFTWQEKKRLLSKVGFEMQFRRVSEKNNNKEKKVTIEDEITNTSLGILFSEKEVTTWIIEAMRESRSDANEELAAAFLDNISRRSGLLLPRGEGLYAFVHLTFQEYFAALYLKDEICSPEFIEDKAAVDHRITTDSLFSWSGDSLWHETLLFLLELVGNPRWAKRIETWIFGSMQANPEDAPPSAWSRLALRVIVADDPHIGLDQTICSAIFEQACASLLNINDASFFLGLPDGREKVFQALCKSPVGSDALLEVFKNRRFPMVILNDCGENFEKISTSEAVAKNTSILFLLETGTDNLDFLSSGYDKLSVLAIDEPNLKNVDAATYCHQLSLISINCLAISDISPLTKCSALRSIFIKNSSITDLSEFLGKAEIEISGNLEKLPKDQREIFQRREKKAREKKQRADAVRHPSAYYQGRQKGLEASRPPKRIG